MAPNRTLRSHVVTGDGDFSNSQVPEAVQHDNVVSADDAMHEADHDSDKVEECKGNEDDLRFQQKVNSIDCIEDMRILPKEESRFLIPLCRMIPMPIVRPSLDSDIKRLEAAFTHGYRPGSSAFYVSICDEKGVIRNLTAEDEDKMSPLWKLESTQFDARLQKNENLKHLVGRMFYICDGNHRFQAWTAFIDRLHRDDPMWHYSVDSIVLDPSGRTALLLNAMHDINKSTENSHVKTNLVHTLHRVRATGTQSLETFKELLPDWEFRKCLKSPARGKTWYPLTTDVFISFLWRQEIADAADEAARKLSEDDPTIVRTDKEITEAMLSAAKVKTNGYKGQFSKLLAVSHPALGDDFLAEVTLHWSRNSKPEMTLDKLQLLATSACPASFKVQCLRWWNSGALTRQGVHFPSKPFSDKDFEIWLNKACFWASLQESVTLEYERMQKEEGLKVLEASSNVPLTPAEYVEYWRTRIWVHGFSSLFRGKESYSRTKAFTSFTYTSRIQKRVLYRYIMFELIPKGTVQQADLPEFISTWVDKTCMDQCMYSTGLIRSWGTLHLKSGRWYIDCGGGFCHSEEDTARKVIEDEEKGLAASDPPTATADQTTAQHDDALDLSHMNEKDKARELRKIKRAAEKAEARRGIEEQKKADKASRANLLANVKAMAAEAVATIKATGKAPEKLQAIAGSGFDDTQTSSASPSRVPRKRDSSAIDLSVSRLSLAHVPVPVTDNMEREGLDAFICNVSLHSILSHRVQYGTFPSGWTDLQAFLEKHKGDKVRTFKGVVSQSRAVDLMIMDIPDGLPVPRVSSPALAIPPWNIVPPEFLKSAFDFASSHLPDDGALLLFHSEAAAVKLQLKSFCRAFHFKVYKKWIGINCLHLSNAQDPSRLTLCFGIQLLVRNLPGVQPSRFQVNVVPGLENSGINVILDDVLHNGVTKSSQLMNGNVPWRGPREKDPGFMQILIESFSLPGDTVFDCSAATGSSIHACRRSGRNIVAFEEDALIFNALLHPLVIEKLSPISKKQRVVEDCDDSDDSDESGSDVPEIEATNLFSQG